VAIIAACFAVTAWAIYGFPLDPLTPFRTIAVGLAQLFDFNEGGDAAYFLGEVREHGWWYFFPIIVFFKTPLPFLLLAAVGLVVFVRDNGRDWRKMAPLLCAVCVLAVAMLGNINFGVRHVLPIYPLLSIVAGYGVARLLSGFHRPLAARAAVASLLLWQGIASAAAHPDYLAYFNELAGEEPERIEVGSDLDWGQDVQRLAAELKARGITHVAVALHTSADLRRHGLPDYEVLRLYSPTSGWVAISLQIATYYCDGFRWLLEREPVAEIGKSIRLYYVDPTTLPPDPDVPGLELSHRPAACRGAER
jgi:hypothetical protein